MLRRKQQRLAAYRSITFWSFPDIGKHNRRPLPACLYMMIRALYPPTDDEDEFADWDYSVFIPEAELDDE